MKEETTWIAIGKALPGIEDVMNFANRPDCGAINIFTGITRNHEKGRKVRTLYYDCYEKMALSELKTIVDKARSHYNIGNIAILHRTGEVTVGSVSLIVAVSAAHRKEAISCTRDLIDLLKHQVPIWKKETFENEIKWKEEP